MSPRFVLGRENVPCVAEVVNRSLKADCTDFTMNNHKFYLNRPSGQIKTKLKPFKTTVCHLLMRATFFIISALGASFSMLLRRPSRL